MVVAWSAEMFQSPCPGSGMTTQPGGYRPGVYSDLLRGTPASGVCVGNSAALRIMKMGPFGGGATLPLRKEPSKNEEATEEAASRDQKKTKPHLKAYLRSLCADKLIPVYLNQFEFGFASSDGKS